MAPVTYVSPARYEALRAVGLGVTIAGGVGLLLMGSALFEGRERASGVGALVVFTTGVAALLWSRARLRALWLRNRAYLLSERGAELLRERRESAGRALWLARWLLALFVVSALVFFFLFSAVSCGNRIDGFCGQVGRPQQWLVVVFQLSSLCLGCAWGAVIYWRRRQEDETDRIDLVVAEGHRRRRSEDPLADAKRATWD